MEYQYIENFDDGHYSQLLEIFEKEKWNKTLNDVKTAHQYSLPFGIFESDSQQLIAYVRVLTDTIKYAFIFDLVIKRDFRQKGIATQLMNYVLNHDRFRNIVYFELTCAPEMEKFYQAFGFGKEYSSIEFGQVIPLRYKKS